MNLTSILIDGGYVRMTGENVDVKYDTQIMSLSLFINELNEFSTNSLIVNEGYYYGSIGSTTKIKP